MQEHLVTKFRSGTRCRSHVSKQSGNTEHSYHEMILTGEAPVSNRSVSTIPGLSWCTP